MPPAPPLFPLPPPPDEPLDAGVPGCCRTHDDDAAVLDEDAVGVDVGLFSDGRPTLTATLLIVLVRLLLFDDVTPPLGDDACCCC